MLIAIDLRKKEDSLLHATWFQNKEYEKKNLMGRTKTIVHISLKFIRVL